MAVSIVKPDRYSECICCGEKRDINEFLFFKDTGIKFGITLCKRCVYNMADMVTKDTVNKLEARNDKRPEDN